MKKECLFADYPKCPYFINENCTMDNPEENCFDCEEKFSDDEEEECD